MPIRFKYPSAERSNTLTPDLEVLEPMIKEGQKDANRIEYDDRQPMPEHVVGFTDGHRLFYNSMGGSRNVENSYVMGFYVFGIVGLIMLFLVSSIDNPKSDHILFTGALAFLLVPAIIITILKSKKPFDQFIVFDRDNGNVLFTGRGRWPNLVVPFEKVGMYTEHYVGKGALIFSAKFDCQMKPKGKWGRRAELITPMGVGNEPEAIMQWAYINRFMDQSKPLPQEPLPTWAAIQWFKERNLTIEDVMNKYGYVEDDPKASWFKWDDTAPEHQIRPEELGV